MDKSLGTDREHFFCFGEWKRRKVYSFRACPCKTIQGKGFKFQESELDREGNWQTIEGNASPLDAVKAWIKPFRSPSIGGLPKFVGGCAGFWGYDVARTIENIPDLASDDLPIPEYMFALYDRIWVWDHQENEVYACVHSYWSQDSPLKGNEREELLYQTYRKAQRAAEEMTEFWRSMEKVNEDLAVRNRRNFCKETAQSYSGGQMRLPYFPFVRPLTRRLLFMPFAEYRNISVKGMYSRLIYPYAEPVRLRHRPRRFMSHSESLILLLIWD
ncbi:hypothetical protein B7C51_13195 [Paenibacillus larvae subsp. pulvifaciens]|uniref:Anthranilate synthase component I N-terminal domain-containing protein n=1 Tax=Paenibacillus larvae subsp. pulvifaciens TaxID=1477 RepID=A0A1V0UU96_9BACL|nr:hypothetical protein B7C51_13195 [Paenibacillus larvae subsp. pulvifaciens]